MEGIGKCKRICEELDKLGLSDVTVYSPEDRLFWVRPWVAKKLEEEGLLEKMGMLPLDNELFRAGRHFAEHKEMVSFRV